MTRCDVHLTTSCCENSKAWTCYAYIWWTVSQVLLEMRIWLVFTPSLFCSRYNRNELGSWVRGWDFFFMSLGLSLGRPMYWLACQIKEQTSPSDSHSLVLPSLRAVLPSTGCPWLSVISTVPKPQIDMALSTPVRSRGSFSQLGVIKDYVLNWACAHYSPMMLHIPTCLKSISHHFQKTSRFLSFIYHCHFHHI